MGKRLVDNNTIRKNRRIRQGIRAAFAALVSGEYFESEDKSLLVRDHTLLCHGESIAWLIRGKVEVTQAPTETIAQHVKELRHIANN